MPVAISVAHAKLQDDSGLAYLEYYLDDPSAEEVRAEYRSIDGEMIVTKRLRFSPEQGFAEFEILDYERFKGFRVVSGDNTLQIQTLRLLENNLRAVVGIDNVATSGPVIVDAGFHRFMLENWDALSAGKRITFNYLLLHKARVIPMVVGKKACADQNQLCLNISLDNILLRYLMPSLRLKYEIESKRLVHYSGPGPLATARGRGLMVNLDYRYLD